MDQNNIRNFCIIAHIDHGKSTLADRLLEITGTIEKRKMKDQLLDTMDLERERGITIKLQPVRMQYTPSLNPSPQGGGKLGEVYELNLIDTPGHVDFAYEVSRSLAACEGAILVVDATQGIQAQTLANVKLALEHGLVLIPVINKIDLLNAAPEDVAIEVKEAFGFSDDEIIFASGKTGENVEAVLKAVIAKIPPPRGRPDAPLQALIFDSKYDKHQGVVAYVRVFNGSVETNQAIRFMNTGADAQSLEVGYFTPQHKKSGRLDTGQVGYIVTGLREVSKARVGDTITLTAQAAVEPLPGYKEVKPMVFASIFPISGDDYPALREAMEKLKLNDASLTYEPESIPSLGFGFRAGFLGLLHMEIVQERLKREFDLNLILTAPSVAYIVRKNKSPLPNPPHQLRRNVASQGEGKEKKNYSSPLVGPLRPSEGEAREVRWGGGELIIYNPSQLPDPSVIREILEPWVTLDIITPERYLGGVMELVMKRRGVYKGLTYYQRDLSPSGRSTVGGHFEIPLSDIISDFYDKLKSVSSGYASMNYELWGYRPADLVKLDILVAGNKAESLSMIVFRPNAEARGRQVVEKLKDLLPKQQFPIALQAVIGGKIIARETVAAMRKDVTAGLYGGDVTRKKKVLEKQKKGKKRMTRHGKVEIPQEAFLALMKR